MSFSTWQEREKYLTYRRDRAGFNQWLLDGRKSSSGADTQLEMLVSLLAPVFDYLGDGYRFGTLERRAWMLLYALRPDLLKGEDMATAARRWGVSKVALHHQLRELRQVLPYLKVDTNIRKGHALDKAASAERKRIAGIERHRKRALKRAALKTEAFRNRVAA
jgi:hypothetical protein